MTKRAQLAAVALVVAAATLVVAAGAASAHSLASSSVTIELSTTGMTGSIGLAVASLDQAFDDAHRSDALAPDAYAAQVVDYLDDHLTIRGADGTEWPEHYSNLVRQTAEGIETITVDLGVDVAGDDPSAFTITYDAVIEAVPAHEAVLVLVDATNRASTPGVFTTSEPVLQVGDGHAGTGMADMARLGLHHVLDGADHLLFLLTLFLPAPLVAIAGRWQRGPGARASLRKVIHVVTAFTLGHSLTLLATSLGWIHVPARPVEVLIAASVAVSAVHAIRPLVKGGEPVIAATFGLIHGMAFAGILAGLGIAGRASVPALLAFNLGIEAAQLLVTACVVPSLFAMATRAAYDTVRLAGASIALVAAGAWMLDRIGLATDPFTGLEQAVIDHPLTACLALAALAVAIRAFDRQAASPPLTPDGSRAAFRSTAARSM